MFLLVDTRIIYFLAYYLLSFTDGSPWRRRLLVGKGDLEKSISRTRYIAVSSTMLIWSILGLSRAI
jgi:hypothetical protein